MFKQATVDAASVPSTQSNFPTYIDLSRLGITTLAEAQSVRVYADEAKTTEWAREIVSLTEMHVKVPSLTSTVTMYVDYDGIRADYAVTDTFGRNNVWSSAIYRYVNHLDGSSAANCPDSTGAGNSLIQKGAPVYQAAGKFDRGYTGDGNDSVPRGFEIANNATLSGTTISFSCWVYFVGHTAGNRFAGLASRTNAAGSLGYTFFRGNAAFSAKMIARINATTYTSSHAVSQDAWHHLVFTHTSNQTKYYINGVLMQTQTTETISTSADRTALGLSAWGFNDTINGTMEEARLGYTVLSDNWITTEHNNQNAESTFWGTWTTVSGGSPAHAARRGAVMMM